ncbi:MAG: hypothetical protein AAF431_11215 [Pseudomonadota bacterium]
MIKFIVSETEIEELAHSVPNFQIMIDAFSDSSEMELVIEDEEDTPPAPTSINE